MSLDCGRGRSQAAALSPQQVQRNPCQQRRGICAAKVGQRTGLVRRRRGQDESDYSVGVHHQPCPLISPRLGHKSERQTRWAMSVCISVCSHMLQVSTALCVSGNKASLLHRGKWNSPCSTLVHDKTCCRLLRNIHFHNAKISSWS